MVSLNSVSFSVYFFCHPHLCHLWSSCHLLYFRFWSSSFRLIPLDYLSQDLLFLAPRPWLPVYPALFFCLFVFLMISIHPISILYQMWESDLAAGIKYAANSNSLETNKTKPNPKPKPSTTNMTAKPRFSNVEPSRDGSQVEGRKREESSDRLDESGSSQDAVDSNSTSSSSPARRRSRTVTVTSEEMSEFVNDRYWTDFPDYTMDDYVY